MPNSVAPFLCLSPRKTEPSQSVVAILKQSLILLSLIVIIEKLSLTALTSGALFLTGSMMLVAGYHYKSICNHCSIFQIKRDA
ncbi:hypothetical protein F5Y16DRAFT_65838 [Xylariaceae sp. FL0255]|nr:hypothetical protein F5Y16DRAFT_65838 [Xylariaceae sp. FL0255]